MSFDLTGRKVLITGAGDGIGRALALAFGEAGARVAGCARTEARMQSLADDIQGHGHVLQTADLTRLKDLEAFQKEVLQQFGGLDVLVNNLGAVGKLADFMELSDADWQASFEVNLLPAVRLSRLCIPSLRQSKTARIINITSIAGIQPSPVFPHYSAMKAGLCNLTSSLAQTLAGDGILVNSVSPGPVWSRSWENEARASAEKSGIPMEAVAQEIKTSTAQTVLLKRMGVPEDVTGLVLFLASDHASWITATNFTNDGGVTQNPY